MLHLYTGMWGEVAVADWRAPSYLAWGTNADARCLSAVIKRKKVCLSLPTWLKQEQSEENAGQHRPQSARHWKITVFAALNWILCPVKVWYTRSVPRAVNPPLRTWFSAELCERGCTFHRPETSNLKSLGCQTPSLKTVQQSDSLQHLAKKKQRVFP